MKTTSIYASAKKSFIFAADCEQRGLNATLKAIYTVIGSSVEAQNTLNFDGLNKSVFASSAKFVEYLKANLPIVFDEKGAICSFKFVDDNEEIATTFAGFQTEKVQINDTCKIKVFVPCYKFTCTQVYNLAKKAAMGAKRAAKIAEKAAKDAEKAANKAANKAAKIAKLEKQLNELKNN